MRKASTELSQSRGLKRRPLLRTSSPLKSNNQLRTHTAIGTVNGGTSGRASEKLHCLPEAYHQIASPAAALQFLLKTIAENLPTFTVVL